MESTEIWKDVIGYPGYLVSSLGSVKGPRSILKPTLRHGYPQITLYKHGKQKHRPIHILVCEAFHGKRPGSPYKIHACHIDGIKTNNIYTNLRWGTVAENHKDSVKHGTSLHGERHHSTSLTWHDVNEIRRIHIPRKNTSLLAKRFGLTKESINNIATFRTWKI